MHIFSCIFTCMALVTLWRLVLAYYNLQMKTEEIRPPKRWQVHPSIPAIRQFCPTPACASPWAKTFIIHCVTGRKGVQIGHKWHHEDDMLNYNKPRRRQLKEHTARTKSLWWKIMLVHGTAALCQPLSQKTGKI